MAKKKTMVKNIKGQMALQSELDRILEREYFLSMHGVNANPGSGGSAHNNNYIDIN